MNSDDEDIDSREGPLRIVASAKRKRRSQIFASDDDETSCDDKAPISTLMRSRTDTEDDVKEDAISRRRLTSVKTKRASETSDDESSYEDNAPISRIKTRYWSKRTTVREDERKRRLTRLRKSEIKNEQDGKNSFDLKNSVCLEDNISNDNVEDNDAIHDEGVYDGLQEEEEDDYDGVQNTKEDDVLEEDDDSVDDEEDYDGLEEEDDYDDEEDEEEYVSEDEEDNDGLTDEEYYDGEHDKEDNDSVKEDDDGDSTNKSEIKNEQDGKNSVCLQENSSIDDEEDKDAIDDEEDYDGLEVEEDYDDEEEDNDDLADEEYYDGEHEEEDNDSVKEEEDDDDDDDSTNKSENAIIDSELDVDTKSSAKTKRVTNLASDEEFSSQTRTLVAQDASKQCLMMLTKSESENELEDESSFDLNQTIRLDVLSPSDEEDNDRPEEGSESEHDSLDGFIVYSQNEDEPNNADDFKVILEQIGRQKYTFLKWDFEGEMLADFGKNPELCMRAVCALYRQQTADEKASKETRYRNGRGFSQTDAYRAGKVAEFLTDGHPAGDLNKTVEELKKHNSRWIKLCMALAAKYSKQLFQIYQKKEDPYFLPE